MGQLFQANNNPKTKKLKNGTEPAWHYAANYDNGNNDFVIYAIETIIAW